MAIYLQKVQSVAEVHIYNFMIIMNNFLWHGVCN